MNYQERQTRKQKDKNGYRKYENESLYLIQEERNENDKRNKKQQRKEPVRMQEREQKEKEMEVNTLVKLSIEGKNREQISITGNKE